MDKLLELRTKSQEFERELVNHIYFSPQFIPRCLTIINKNDFSKYGKHFEVIIESFKNEKNLEIAFKDAGLKVTDFFTGTVSLRSVESMCNDLKDVSNAIVLWEILQKKLEQLPHQNVKEYISTMQREIVSNIKNEERARTDVQSVLKEFEDRKELYKQKKANGSELLGISTGYSKLDDAIDGLRPGHLWIIGGYTSMGKTTASLNIIANLIKQGKRVVFYSLEMNAVDIFSRLLGVLSNDNGLSIIKGYAKDETITNENIQKIVDSKLSIHSGVSELSEILYSMYEESLSDETTVFVVDFMQLMTIKGAKSEYETITNCTLELQQCAKRLKIPIIALSQVSNDGAKSGDSVVMSFKGSGAIAAAADLAIEIMMNETSVDDWKRKMYAGEDTRMKWSIRKNRHGKVGAIEMNFNGRTGIFTQEKTVDDIYPTN